MYACIVVMNTRGQWRIGFFLINIFSAYLCPGVCLDYVIAFHSCLSVYLLFADDVIHNSLLLTRLDGTAFLKYIRLNK